MVAIVLGCMAIWLLAIFGALFLYGTVAYNDYTPFQRFLVNTLILVATTTVAVTGTVILILFT